MILYILFGSQKQATATNTESDDNYPAISSHPLTCSLDWLTFSNKPLHQLPVFTSTAISKKPPVEQEQYF